MNYGNAGRLMEDFWDTDWQTFAADFGKFKALGANVVRVHFQVGTVEEYDALERAGKLTINQALYYREWLRLFVRLKPEFVPESAAPGD